MEQHVLANELFDHGFGGSFPGRSHVAYVGVETLDPTKLYSTAVMLMTYKMGSYVDLPDFKKYVEGVKVEDIPRFPSGFTGNWYFDLDLNFSSTPPKIRLGIDAINQKLEERVLWKRRKRKALEERGRKYVSDVSNKTLFPLYSSILGKHGNYPVRTEVVEDAARFVDDVSKKLSEFTEPNINSVNKHLEKTYREHFNQIMLKEKTAAA